MCRQGLSDTPGDRAVIRDTHDEASFALHQWLRFRHPIASISQLMGAATFDFWDAGQLLGHPTRKAVPVNARRVSQVIEFELS